MQHALLKIWYKKRDSSVGSISPPLKSKLACEALASRVQWKCHVNRTGSFHSLGALSCHGEGQGHSCVRPCSHPTNMPGTWVKPPWTFQSSPASGRILPSPGHATRHRTAYLSLSYGQNPWLYLIKEKKNHNRIPSKDNPQVCIKWELRDTEKEMLS